VCPQPLWEGGAGFPASLEYATGTIVSSQSRLGLGFDRIDAQLCYRESPMSRDLQRAAKGGPLKFFAVFSATVQNLFEISQIYLV